MKVAASTQNQAFNTLLFLYREVLNREFGDLGEVVRAKKTRNLPAVFSKAETRKIINQLEGRNWLMAQLMYGAELRVMECVRLRVKDVDFDYRQILVRNGKGGKDRITILPEIIVENMKRHHDPLIGGARLNDGIIYMKPLYKKHLKRRLEMWELQKQEIAMRCDILLPPIFWKRDTI